MELLNTCLVNGGGIRFQSKQECVELLEACYQLGYKWHWSAPHFSTYPEDRFIVLSDDYLFWAKSKNLWVHGEIELYDWTAIKAKSHCGAEFYFVY